MLRALLFSWIILLTSSAAWAQKPASSLEPMRVTLINVEIHNWFWDMMMEVARKAATDLGIELEIIDTKRDHLLYRKAALAVMERGNAPDYLLIGNEKESAAKIILNSGSGRTRIFLFNNGFISPENRLRFATPRGLHPQWIGQLIPDNFQAGRDGAVKLFEVLQRRYPEPQEIPILALTGSFNTHSSLERERGFLDAVEHFPRIKVMQRVSAEWNGTLAETKTALLLNRYPKVVGIWAANDEMAEGAMRGAEKHGKVPGRDIFFAGCGWSRNAVKAILEKRMVASTGGHFMDPAWVLARLYDYHHRIDELMEQPPSPFFVLSEENAARLALVVDKKLWLNFDFRKWSRVYNPKLKSYAENLKQLLEGKE